MLNLEELFKKRPFVYLVNDVYYAFGTGVCARCDKGGTYVTLPSRYQNYLDAQSNDSISQGDAWDIYRKLVSVADAVKESEEHIHLPEKFEKLNFSNAEKEEIEIQVKKLVAFFRKHDLADFY